MSQQIFTHMEDNPKHPAVAALFSELLAATKLNAAGLAKKLDITPQAISNYVVGRNEPGRKMMAAIIKAFPAINAVWLATGEGVPFPNGVHNEKAAAPAQTIDTADPSTKMEPATSAAASEGNPDMITHADSVLALAKAEGKIEQLQQENEWLRSIVGKESPSSDAADDTLPSDPTTPTGPQPILSVQHRRRAGFRQQGVSLD